MLEFLSRGAPGLGRCLDGVVHVNHDGDVALQPTEPGEEEYRRAGQPARCSTRDPQSTGRRIFSSSAFQRGSACRSRRRGSKAMRSNPLSCSR